MKTYGGVHVNLGKKVTVCVFKGMHTGLVLHKHRGKEDISELRLPIYRIQARCEMLAK
jgi:hypothetical protein